MTSDIYRYRTYQYIGPSMDQNLYDAPDLLTAGSIVEPVNVQWVTDPSTSCTNEQKRLQVRGRLRVPPAVHYRNPVAYQYRPFM